MKRRAGDPQTHTGQVRDPCDRPPRAGALVSSAGTVAVAGSWVAGADFHWSTAWLKKTQTVDRSRWLALFHSFSVGFPLLLDPLGASWRLPVCNVHARTKYSALGWNEGDAEICRPSKPRRHVNVCTPR
jgi:hypothetical protein